jgi:hypothetical protein
MDKRFFGYIEGYYGRMLSWDERMTLVKEMRELGLNAYLYAPKEDPYHRLNWRIPYPKSWIDSFSAFVKQGSKSGITVAAGIAPGLSYDYQSASDYSALIRKCLSLMKTGVRTICLLMDDIPVKAPAPFEKTYSSLGTAHGRLLTQLKKDLLESASNIRVWFCPTIYTDQFIGSDPATRRYLPDLALSMPPDTLIFWTGSHVISREISAASLKGVLNIFGDRVCIWDNIYAHDYCPGRLFLGPYERRNKDVMKAARGILLNPTGLVQTDILLLSQLAGYARSADAKKTWEKSLSVFPFAGELKIIAPYFSLPFADNVQALLTSPRIKRAKAALKKLIGEWKSPLQREWYPFLYMLDCDLALFDEKSPPGREWIKKKYPPVLAAALNAPR